MLSRREFCKYVAAATCGASLFDPAAIFTRAVAEDVFTAKALGPGRWVISGRGGNMLLVKSKGRIVLIDAGVGAVADELLAKVTKHTGDANCTLINTHHHPDHIGGNFVIRRGFQDEVPIIGQSNLAPRVAATLEGSIRPGLLGAAEGRPDQEEYLARVNQLTADDFAPTVTFNDEHEVQAGKTTFQLHHYGAGHTDNDTVVFLPRENILHTGDLVFNNLHPYVIAEHGASVKGWRTSLSKALELCDEKTVVIPGHGSVGDRTILVEMKKYFDQIFKIVIAAIKEGRSRDEVAALKPEVFAGRGLANVQYMALTKVYDELNLFDVKRSQPVEQ